MKTLLLIKAFVTLTHLAYRGKLAQALRAVANNFPEAAPRKKETSHKASSSVISP